MKKIIFGVLLGSILLFGAAYGLLGESYQLADISQQKYKISLEEAIQLYQKETKQDSCTAISFDAPEDVENPSAASYNYVFEDGDTIVRIDPNTGKITKSKQKLVKMSQQKRKITLHELKQLPMPKDAMSKALKRVQGKNNQVISWRLQKNHVTPSYTVTVNQNHAQKRILVD
ncbi:hypothetical protein RV11_GL001886 [Enterococcus phoeniculicola]|jgi:uncharacterized membrane protein YkoI|uniref:Uncharacterized protein n=1 Tax=Enterococcus phoeniculicola ATCC BAA-412 TaxID=1158610 RepID=R3W490_9ENTE|nr:PepSY domain-containing protein [Enterococcus phoeniculicola]EOL42336.1 hypothetical protein UC3_02688 [Enterococcus phoeniculicola ATCC BAA-412]EOT79385.1 hypothetical protein I589_00893 [Enterococcus phoeniculicola ATCC BAA-412]OJG73076.1 hypothetical protein RV11_GL001886 [Enterococcus phoeniculicola]